MKVIAAGSLALVLLACSSGTGPTTATAPSTAAAPAVGHTAYPLTIKNCGSTETFTKPPSTVLTEGSDANSVLLIQLGLKGRIVKTTSFSTRSDTPGMTEQLQSLNRVQVPGNGLAREDAIALHPDLVIAGEGAYFQGEYASSHGMATREQLHAAGIQAYTPEHFCAADVSDAAPDLVAAQKARTIDSDLQTITQLGQIFDVNDRAAALVAEIRQAFDEVRTKTAGLPAVRVTVLDPSVADAASGGKVYVYGGTVLDSVLAAAGGTNVWSDQGDFGSVSREAALARPADVVVFGEYDGAPAPDAVRTFIQTTFSSWPAAKNKTIVELDDTVNLQITSGALVTQLAKTLHPDAFK